MSESPEEYKHEAVIFFLYLWEWRDSSPIYYKTVDGGSNARLSTLQITQVHHLINLILSCFLHERTIQQH